MLCIKAFSCRHSKEKVEVQLEWSNTHTLPKNSGREIKPSKTQIDGLENIITPHNTLSEHHIQHCQVSYNIPLHTNPNLENRDYQQVPPRDTL